MAFSNVGSFSHHKSHYTQHKACNGTQKRFAHRSSDSAFIKNAQFSKDGAHFCKRAIEQWTYFPDTAERAWITAGVMRKKGLFPFFHAQTSVIRPYRIFVETIQNKSFENFYRPLRVPRHDLFISHSEMTERIADFVTRYGSTAWTSGVDNSNVCRMDADPFFRRHMVSMSYSIVHTQFQESATHFMFLNKSSVDDSTTMHYVEEECATPLRCKGMDGKKEKIYAKMRFYAERYAELKMGTLFVIGIPVESISRFVFDAKSFGVPTYQDMRSIIKDPTASPRAYSEEEGGMQARFMVFDETLKMSSNIEVIDVMDLEECSRYVKGKDYTNPRTLTEFEPFFKNKSSEIEGKDTAERNQLDAEVRKFAYSIKD